MHDIKMCLEWNYYIYYRQQDSYSFTYLCLKVLYYSCDSQGELVQFFFGFSVFFIKISLTFHEKILWKFKWDPLAKYCVLFSFISSTADNHPHISKVFSVLCTHKLFLAFPRCEPMGKFFIPPVKEKCLIRGFPSKILFVSLIHTQIIPINEWFPFQAF